MIYHQLTLRAVPKQHLEPLEFYLTEVAEASAVTLLKTTPGLLVSEIDQPHPQTSTMTIQALFTEAPDWSTIAKALITFDIEIERDGTIEILEDQDWQKNFRQHFEPFCIEERLWVFPAWESEKAREHENALCIDPGMAFGTGQHATTALCLQAMATLLKPNDTVIDYGCGSGILALSALKLGASSVAAIDIDETAIEACHRNATANTLPKASQSLTINLADSSHLKPARIVLANILAPILIELANKLAALTESGGYLILSGLLEEQSESVLKTYKKNFNVSKILQNQGWICLILEKP